MATAPEGKNFRRIRFKERFAEVRKFKDCTLSDLVRVLSILQPQSS